MFAILATYLVICGLLVGCSSAKKTEKQQFASVELSEDEYLRYWHNLIEGTKFRQLGNLPMAANLLTNCTEINPYGAAAHFQLAEIYTVVDDRRYALKHSRLAVRYAPENEWYKLQLANLYLHNNNIDSAIIVFRRIVDNNPYDVELRQNMAMLYLENFDFRRALRELDRAERIAGLTQEIIVAKYMVFTKKGDVKSTETLLKNAVETFPYELRFYGLLAELYSLLGREDEAQQFYTRLLEVDPENAIGYISMIEFYKDYGRDDKAIEGMQQMFAMKSIDPDLKVELFLQLSDDSAFFRKHIKELDIQVKKLFEKYPENFRVRLINSDRNMREENYEGARDDLLFMTNLLQTNYHLWEHLFHLLYLLDENETLFETTTKALQHFADRYLVQFFNGFSASMLSKYDDAISAYHKVIELLEKERNPNLDIKFQTYVLLGEATNNLQRFDESDYAFDKALQMSPDNPVVLNNYAYYLSLREEKLDLAEKYIMRCLSIEPDRYTFLDTYGWVLYKLGHIDEAIIMIEKAIKNGGGNSSEIIDHYCELLTVAGRISEAEIICQQAIELTNSEMTVIEKMETFLKNIEEE